MALERKTGLSPLQTQFVKVYDGNAFASAKAAGYLGNDNSLRKTASALMKNPQIIRALKKRAEKEKKPLVASRKERQSFWTEVMYDPEADIKDRLKASELLGRSEADFTDKLEHSGKQLFEHLVLSSIMPPTPTYVDVKALPRKEDEDGESATAGGSEAP